MREAKESHLWGLNTLAGWIYPPAMENDPNANSLRSFAIRFRKFRQSVTPTGDGWHYAILTWRGKLNINLYGSEKRFYDHANRTRPL